MIRKHLWRDLRPWICHDAACGFSNESFVSREDWIEHLEFDHCFRPAWSSFQCSLCHEETGEGKTAIIHHLSSHMEEISLAALPSGYDSDNDLKESEDEDGDGNGGKVSAGSPSRDFFASSLSFPIIDVQSVDRG